MKPLIFSCLFFLSIICSQQGFSQATNNSADAWIINFYGANTVVNSLQQNVPINIGTDCQAGISVTVQAPPDCEVLTPTPAGYNATCTPDTDRITFEADQSTSVPVNATCTGLSFIYINPKFTFE